MTDLYQQAPGSKGYGPQDWEVVRRMAPGAMLLWVVPVEPDYEAAHLSLYDSTKWHQPLADAIDAALGVGEETP